MKLILPVILGVAISPATWPVAHSQIFSGISETGTVVLSNIQGTAANMLVVAAPSPHTADPVGAVGGPTPPLANAPAANMFLPFIAEASRVSHLPVELIHAIIAAESNYNPRAVSPKGARGLMQLMPATARRFGGGDAFDPRQNILAGSRYLRWLMDHFDQNMELAIAAYNAGEGAVVRAGNRVPRNSETLKYVPKVLEHYHRALSGILDNNQIAKLSG